MYVKMAGMPNAPTPHSNSSATDADLLLACKQRRFDDALAAMDRGANPNVRDEEGNSPLHSAAWFGESSACAKFIGFGARPNAVNKDRSTPMIFSAMQGHTDTCRVLYEMGADPDVLGKNQWNAMSWALSVGHPTTGIGLASLTMGPINIWIDPGKTVAKQVAKARENRVHTAAKLGWGGVCLKLLAMNFHPSKKDGRGKTPAQVAEAAGHPEVATQIRAWIAQGAASDALRGLQNDGVTP